MALRDFELYLRGRLNTGLAAVLNGRRRGRATPLPLDAVLAASRPAPLDYVRLLEGRSNPDRQKVLGQLLAARGIPFARFPFATLEGSGENFAVDVGGGLRTLILVGHHDAVPGSPGANDDASAVAILLELLGQLAMDPPRRLTVRFLFTAAEEVGYLGARCYVRTVPLDRVVGVLSLELCGIGDALAIWDALPPADRGPMLQAFAGALEALGYRRDETYHVVGRIPVFGSDHRAFTAVGVPAFGLTAVPSSDADALRRFIFNPLRSVFYHLGRRPRPFDTYHTARDGSSTLEPEALARTCRALAALVRALDEQ
ncbi:MAG: Zn-dependent exopeptidase M28 [Candidatus Rokubacteria bacterium]|nr:Zn-dependent exopeptidase M28 [Candidatus Rokubacteria bacterium]